MTNGGKNKRVAFIILFSNCSYIFTMVLMCYICVVLMSILRKANKIPSECTHTLRDGLEGETSVHAHL